MFCLRLMNRRSSGPDGISWLTPHQGHELWVRGSYQVLSTTATDEPRALLEYPNRFHHDTNPAWATEAINDERRSTMASYAVSSKESQAPAVDNGPAIVAKR
jgi:hypothetical protein